VDDLNLWYHELDLPANTTKKIAALRGRELTRVAQQECGLDLSGEETKVDEKGSRLRFTNRGGYWIHPVDLRDLPGHGKGGLEPGGILDGVQTDVPTLLLSECCLIYLSPPDADAVLNYLTGLFPATTPLGIVIYEPIHPHDAFGRTMVANLTARGIELQTLEEHATLAAQRDRLRRFGFGAPNAGTEDEGGGGGGEGAPGDRGAAGAMDMDFMWRHWVDPGEQQRVVSLEWLDEVEELVLMAQHYCVAWGWRDGGEGGARAERAFSGWRALRCQVGASWRDSATMP